MTFITVRCPHCQSEQIVKRGKTRRGTQRYLCQSTVCTTGSFLLDYRNRGCLPEVKQTIIDMSLNASEIRDTARVLRISTDTVLRARKKKEAVLESVNTASYDDVHCLSCHLRREDRAGRPGRCPRLLHRHRGRRLRPGRYRCDALSRAAHTCR